MPDTIHKTATHVLIEDRLNRSLNTYVARKRRDEISWERIAKAIHEETGVRVTGVAIRNWFPKIS